MNFAFGYKGSTGVMVMQELCRDSGKESGNYILPIWYTID